MDIKSIKYIAAIVILVAISILVGIKLGKESVNDSTDSNQVIENITTNNIIDTDNAIREVSADNKTNKNLKYDVSYSTEHFSSYNENNEKVCESERNIPTILNNNNPDSAKVIESDLRTIMDDVWENEVKKTSEEVKIRVDGDRILGVKYFVNMEYQTSRIITFSIKLDGDFGGVSWNRYELYSYDAQTGELLTLNNIGSDAENLKKQIVEKTKDVTTVNQILIDDTGNVGIDKLLIEKMQSHGNFGITGDGMHINYQKYDIANGAAGIVEVVLEKDIGNKYVCEKYLID